MNTHTTSLTRRHAVVLASVLTLAFGTGAAAVAGLTHSPHAATTPAVAAVTPTPAPAPTPVRWDD